MTYILNLLRRLFFEEKEKTEMVLSPGLSDVFLYDSDKEYTEEAYIISCWPYQVRSLTKDRSVHEAVKEIKVKIENQGTFDSSKVFVEPIVPYSAVPYWNTHGGGGGSI